MPKVTRQTLAEAASPKTGPTTRRITSGPTQTSRSNGEAPTSLFDAAVPVGELRETGHKFLIFGQSGTGKTTLACDFPKPLLLIRPEEVEDGSRSVRLVKGVNVTPQLTDPDQLSEICEGQRATGRYRTLVLDGVGDLQSLCVKKHMNFQDVPVKMTWGLVAQPDWNKIGIIFQEAVRDLLRLTIFGTHVILVGADRVLGGKEEGEAASEVKVPKVTVALTPGSAGWLHKVCDYNVYTFVRAETKEVTKDMGGKKVTSRVSTGQQEFCLRLDTCDGWWTKFRKDKGQQIPMIMTDPSFVKLDELIQRVS